MTAYNPKGSGNGVQQQATKYLYTSEVNASWQTEAVYPDSTDVLSQDGTSKVWTFTTDNGDHVSTGYDQLGRTTGTTDQRGVVHTFTFDDAGRLSADTVTSLGSSGIVDGSVRRVGTAYDDIGRVAAVTNYSDTAGTTAVNQVEYEYNGWGRVYREHQEHDGVVDGNSLFVQYDYADGASGGVAKYVRLDQVTYPNGREVHYDYGATGATDDIMSRIATIGDGTNTHASYKYLGANQIVEEDYEDIEVKLSYLDGSGDVTGLDRFGRVVDQVWDDYGASETLDRYTYTYDRVGNRTAKDNELHSDFDEDYTYDALNRLTDADRADTFDQSWDLDGQGNFSSFDDDGDAQTRTTNEANEIEGITGGSVTPTYDDAGNMISGPKPGDDTTRVHYIYDAWNCLVEVREDDSGSPGDLIAEYVYDGQKRRIEKVVDGTSDVHYYYNQQWQMLEEVYVDEYDVTVSSNEYIPSPRYVDARIARFHDGNGDGDYEDGGDNVRYYTSDANHNVTATIDADSGAVVERYVYSAYGTATVYDNNWANPAAPTNDGPMYCGYFFDSESGLYQVRNRYYDAGLSTWISRDPIGYEAHCANLYEYVFDSPTNRMDPTGLQAAPIGPSPSRPSPSRPSTPRPSAPSPTMDQICMMAKIYGLSGTDIGGIVCYNGMKIPCAWNLRLGVNAIAVNILDSCTIAHENAEMRTADCPRCGISRATTKNPKYSHCQGLKSQLACLQAKDVAAECHNDMACIGEVNLTLIHVQKEISKNKC